jgi:MFS family permease
LAGILGKAHHRPISLWRNRNFTAFWIGETVSQVGSQVTLITLPLVAVLTLNVSSRELGLLRFMEYVPFLAFTLLFGVLADRCRRRPLMIASNAVRGVLIALIPLLAALDLLTLPLLATVAFVVGTGAALFEVCWLSYVPHLVGRDRLVEAMSKVSTSHSAAEVAGPGLGGLLVQFVTAPFALVLDALSYLVSVVSLLTIRHPESAPSTAVRRHLGRELVEGLRFAFGEPHIRATAIVSSMGNFFAFITETAFLLYAVRELHFPAGLIGLILTAIGVGGLLGAVFAHAVSRRFPYGRVYVTARVIGGFGAILLPLAAGSNVVVVAMCFASFFLVQVALANTNVLSTSLRQALTPDAIRGRMNASVRTLAFGSLSLGGLAAGWLGDGIGLHATLWLAAIGYAATVIPVLASPLPRLRTLPSTPNAG